MAIVLEPSPGSPALPGGSSLPSALRGPSVDPGVIRRPVESTKGIVSWLTTVDHKRIGIMYGALSLIWFVVGGVEALLIRLQLAKPNGEVISAATYNQMFTMHGTTMVFLVVMPLSSAFFNYFLPLQIGARDVAFPRLNAFSWWLYVFGGFFMYSSFFLGGAPNGGWFGYAPNTSITFSPGHNIDFWIFGLQILGIGSTVSAVNFIATIINMRAPGMTLFRMPVFTWMTFVASFLMLFAMPIITVALFLLMIDRTFGGNFFNPAQGGDPVLWQHLFWLFGHPEVYILILPAMGIVSEVLPAFARKPLFGYPVVVFSGIAIGFMGWGVWAHHMFAVGLGPVATAAFGVSTMFIAVPTGVKIFNWTATLWGGAIRFTTAMCFSVGFITTFVIGGLSGVTHSVVTADTQQTDTYYIVAHFHYVLFGGALMGLFSGFYYWWPKIFGKMLNERLGKVHFWLMLIGMHVTFGPMHIVGLHGQPRRMYRYDKGMGFDFWNLVETIGAFVIAVSLLVFFANVLRTFRSKEMAPADPWDARTVEWMTDSPPKPWNFDIVPVVHTVDEFWHRKYAEDEDGQMRRVATAEQVLAHDPVDPAQIHMPSPSWWPLITTVGFPILAYGMLYRAWPVAAVGAVWILAGFFGWSLEPSAAPHDDHHDDAGHGDVAHTSFGELAAGVAH
jgi:cytochrome c oxidase subunit I